MPSTLQRTLALGALVILSPVLVLISFAVRATSPGPALHRAIRARPGGAFTLYKFRTMRVNGTALGPSVTAAGDRRITQLGRSLRRTKLDELPQLWNVVRGDMALVGPRPEDPRYVDLDDPLHRTVFGALPGITGPTALAYRDEETVLADAALVIARASGRGRATDDDIDHAYRTVILPAKLAMDAEYLRTRSTHGDLAILGQTVGRILPRIARK